MSLLFSSKINKATASNIRFQCKWEWKHARYRWNNPKLERCHIVLNLREVELAHAKLDWLIRWRNSNDNILKVYVVVASNLKRWKLLIKCQPRAQKAVVVYLPERYCWVFVYNLETRVKYVLALTPWALFWNVVNRHVPRRTLHIIVVVQREHCERAAHIHRRVVIESVFANLTSV